MKVLNAVEPYTQKWLKWSILCYTYFTTIKFKFNSFFFFKRVKKMGKETQRRR